MNKMRLIVIVVSCLLLNTVYSISSVKLSNWKTYTSLVNVKDLAFDGESTIWLATSGGVFSYNLLTEELNEYRNTEGLLSLKISAIAFNPIDNSLYIGSEDGYLHILTEDGIWYYITDIVTANYSNPIIDKITFFNDKAILSGGFGITIFNTEERVFEETVSRFADMLSEPLINDFIIVQDRIWAATSEGLVSADLRFSIADPKIWDLYNHQGSTSDNDFKHLVLHDGSIYFSTEKQIFKLNDTVEFVADSKDDWEITDLDILDGQLIYSSPFELFYLNNVAVETKYYWKSINAIHIIDYQNEKIPVLMYKDFAISYIINNENIHITPNSPVTNNFMDMDVDSKNGLWVATRSKSQQNGNGFSLLDKSGKWTNFELEHNEENLNQCLKINVLQNDDIYISTWGTGLIKLTENENNEFEYTVYDTSNSPYTGAVTTALSYVIMGEVQENLWGEVWTINYGEGNTGPLLSMIKEDGSFVSFENDFVNTERQYIDLAIDSWGVKWLGSNKFSKGIYYLYDNNTPDDKSDDKSGKITKSNSDLKDNDIKDIEVDKTGILWIATSSGLNFIYDTYSAVTGEEIYVREETNLRNQYINDIHVDALNNKWIATNKGVWVLNEDASELLNAEIINSTNSPLISDEVFSITSDPELGIVYFGTSSGLSAAQSTSVLASEVYDIICYPQPFSPGASDRLVIDGLVENSDVRILSTDGTLVKALTARGRTVIWDGKHENGDTARNGVYLVVASSSSKGTSSVGKFSILKK